MNPLSHTLDRRSLLRGTVGAAAAVALLSPVSEQARAAEATRRGVFGFGVASGDPTGTDVVLWTRVSPTSDATPGSGLGPAVSVRWELAEDEAFSRVVRTGVVRTDAARDHTVKVDVTGLSPYTRYWYRFSALGSTSPVGRTQTAPDDRELHALRFGVASCANFTGGYFSAYRHLAARDDIDAVLFLGDYIYEYGNGEDRYGPPELAGKRDHVPAVEPVTLQQYRMRHGCYKADLDLQAAHRRHPWIMIFDDHEVCDNTYDKGGVNHQPATEGEFAKRRAAAYQAYLEWVPLRLPDQTVPHQGTRFWRSFSYGSLADLHVLESRQNRSQQVSGTDGAAVDDPARHLLEPAQMTWLQQDLNKPVARWRLLANQVVFAPVRLPPLPDLGPLVSALEQVGVARNGAVFNADQWDGYAADQKSLVRAAATAKGDVVVLTGDIHSSWANDIPLDPGTYVPADPANNSVAVEFVTPSVTSDGFMEIFGDSAEAASAATTAFQASNRHIRYLEGVHHGFLVVDVTPERVQTDFVYITTRLDPEATAFTGASWTTDHGSRQVRVALQPVGARSDQPRQRIVRAPSAARPPASSGTPTASAQLPATGGSGALPAVAAGVLGLGAALIRRRSSGLQEISRG